MSSRRKSTAPKKTVPSSELIGFIPKKTRFDPIQSFSVSKDVRVAERLQHGVPPKTRFAQYPTDPLTFMNADVEGPRNRNDRSQPKLNRPGFYGPNAEAITRKPPVPSGRKRIREESAKFQADMDAARVFSVPSLQRLAAAQVPGLSKKGLDSFFPTRGTLGALPM